MGLSDSLIGRTLPGERGDALPQSPEIVFLSWLLGQPQDADLRSAAAAELERLAAYEGRHGGPRRLRTLFSALIASLDTKVEGV